MRRALVLVAAVAASFTTVAAPAGTPDGEPTWLLPLPDGATAGPGPNGPTPIPPGTCITGPRATDDRPDLRDGYVLHVIYLVPSDISDKELDTNGRIECSVRSFDRWFTEQTALSGAPLRWKLDTYTFTDPGGVEREAIDVTYLKSTKPASSLDGAGEVRAELESLDFRLPKTRYLSYVESGPGHCGDAFTGSLTGNVPVDGKYSQIYLRSPAGCHARDFGVPGSPNYAETIAMQEMIHNDGIVPLGAPHGCEPGLPIGHVCTALVLAFAGTIDPESIDVMFPFVSHPLSGKRLDPGNEDYFRTPLPIRDLENGFYLEPAA